MNRIAKSFLTVVALGVSGVVFAGSDSGLYLGGSVGTAHVDYSENSPQADINDDDTAYKVFAGYNFGLIPFLNIAVEGSYVDFGTQEGEIQNTQGNKIELNAYTAAGLLGFDLGPVGLFAKVGVANWNGDIKTKTAGNDSQSGTDPLYGLGAKMQLGSFAVRAEYEIYDLDKYRVDYYSVGAAYTF